MWRPSLKFKEESNRGDEHIVTSTFNFGNSVVALVLKARTGRGEKLKHVATGRHRVGRMSEASFTRHCARSEAIRRKLDVPDCFAASRLATTKQLCRMERQRNSG